MKLHRAPLAIVLAGLSVLPAVRAAEPPAPTVQQQATMAAWEKAGQLGPEHARLAEQLAGQWSTRQTLWTDQDNPPYVSQGRAVHSPVLGGRQIRFDFKGDFGGTPFEGTGLMGYDNATGRYVGTWADNMVTGIVIGQGRYDAATRTYHMQNRVSDPLHPGKEMTVRETLQVVDADHLVQETFESNAGQEQRTMRIEYTRER